MGFEGTGMCLLGGAEEEAFIPLIYYLWATEGEHVVSRKVVSRWVSLRGWAVFREYVYSLLEVECVCSCSIG